ncbi:GL11926 [Drosophila persimilis]|uniref:GL11926 n=1 Tax=Drosophila persimilis TaxID=7234 RepID=B4H3G0_DROPE|nr:GL11926 [Drosophila persimilis]
MRRLSRKLGEPRRRGIDGEREPDCDVPEPLLEELPELLWDEQLERDDCEPERDLELREPLALLLELERLWG